MHVVTPNSNKKYCDNPRPMFSPPDFTPSHRPAVILAQEIPYYIISSTQDPSDNDLVNLDSLTRNLILISLCNTVSDNPLIPDTKLLL